MTDDPLARMFAAMDEVALTVASAVPDELNDALTLLGRAIGDALLPLLAEHHAGWVNKKAVDSISDRIMRPVIAGMNERLGLPPDYVG